MDEQDDKRCALWIEMCVEGPFAYKFKVSMIGLLNQRRTKIDHLLFFSLSAVSLRRIARRLLQ